MMVSVPDPAAFADSVPVPFSLCVLVPLPVSVPVLPAVSSAAVFALVQETPATPTSIKKQTSRRDILRFSISSLPFT
jgi:hypothetical protein